MNKKDLKDIEKKLLEERARLLEAMDHLDRNVAQSLKDASGDLSAYSMHMADQGSDAFEREMNHLLSTTEGRLLVDTVEALRRLYRGEYGSCLSCGKKITRERLQAVPQARLCVTCQARTERGGR
jgi:RNA polymerase-binding transcription factor DksA